MINKLKKPHSIISKIWPIILLVIVLPTFLYTLYYFGQDTGKLSDQSSLEQDIEHYLSDIHQRWSEGFSSSELEQSTCTDIPAASALWSCSPEILKCYLENKLRVKPQKFSHKFTLLSEQFKVDAFDNIQLQFKISPDSKILNIKLKNNCHQILLPKKVYSSGPKGETELLWDNFGQQIFVDRYYINQKQIYKWSELKGFKLDKLINKDSSKVALNLDLSQRQEYCQDKGGQLLQSHVFDAFVFYPTKSSNLQFKYMYPWGRDSIDKDQKSTESCERVYALECQKEQTFKNYMTSAVSWSGLFYALGGYPETFINIVNPSSNLKVSSIFQDINSHWHENGLRANWNGSENFENGVDFTEQNRGRIIPSKQITGAAFRCMYYR